jgi:hypothetical protein
MMLAVEKFIPGEFKLVKTSANFRMALEGSVAERLSNSYSTGMSVVRDRNLKPPKVRLRVTNGLRGSPRVLKTRPIPVPGPTRTRNPPDPTRGGH